MLCKKWLTTAAIAILFLLVPTQAGAITRSEVLDRGKEWVHERVPYSQSRYYEGYRQDCSGFVSMAWKLNTSRTTRTFDPVTKRIDPSKLKPGDAVLTPRKHVVLFVKWIDKEERSFLCYEESTWGKPAKKSVKHFRQGQRAIRFDGIENDPVVLPPPPESKPETMSLFGEEVIVDPPSMVESSPSLDPFQDPLDRFLLIAGIQR